MPNNFTSHLEMNRRRRGAHSMSTIDVPMYFARWQEQQADGAPLLGLVSGLYDIATRWIVTHDLAEWKDEIAWMSLYFSMAVWASLALCVFYSLADHLPR